MSYKSQLLQTDLARRIVFDKRAYPALKASIYRGAMTFLFGRVLFLSLSLSSTSIDVYDYMYMYRYTDFQSCVLDRFEYIDRGNRAL